MGKFVLEMRKKGVPAAIVAAEVTAATEIALDWTLRSVSAFPWDTQR